jgi:hypothetical protein
MRVAENRFSKGGQYIAGSGGKSSNYLCVYYHHCLNMNIDAYGDIVHSVDYSFPGKAMNENSFERQRSVGHISSPVFISWRKS